MLKTSICFSTNIRVEVRDKIVRVSGARISGDFEKYLDLPIVIGRST